LYLKRFFVEIFFCCKIFFLTDPNMAQTGEQSSEFRMDFVQQVASQSAGNDRPVTFIAQTPSTSGATQPDPRLLQSPTEEHKTAEQKGTLLR
jgi:hypothetical protein